MLQLNQLVIDGQLANLGTVDRDSVKNALTILNSLLGEPCKVSMSGTTLSVGSSSVTLLESDGSYGQQSLGIKSIPPISGRYAEVAAGTINLATGSVTGSFATGLSGLSMTNGEYVGVALELRSDKSWYVNFGVATAVKADVFTEANSPTFTSDAPVKKGFMTLRKNGAGAWDFATLDMADFVALPIGAGVGGGGASNIAETDITTASAGTWESGYSGTPRIAVWYYTNTSGIYELLSPASYSLSTNGTGGIDYDFSTLTFGTGDLVKIVADFGSIASTPATEYDSGNVTVSAINDTLKGASVAGYHEVTLPAGFTTFPKGYTITRNNGTDVFPADPASTLVFSYSGTNYRVAVDTTGWGATDTFRLVCSLSPLPVGGTSTDAEVFENKTIDGDLNTITNLAHGAEVDDPTTGAHGVVGEFMGTLNTQSVSNKTIIAANNNISGLLHGTHVDNPTSGAHGITGDFVGTTDVQELSGKSLVGGTASETVYWTVPSHTTTGLDAITPRKAAVAYDRTEQVLKVNDGITGWINSSGGAGSGEWTPYTPVFYNTGGVAQSVIGTPQLVRYEWRRVEDEMEIRLDAFFPPGAYVSGVTSEFSVGIPSPYTIDTSLVGSRGTGTTSSPATPFRAVGVHRELNLAVISPLQPTDLTPLSICTVASSTAIFCGSTGNNAGVPNSTGRYGYLYLRASVPISNWP